MKKINVNGYEIAYNSFWKRWIVSHAEIGAGIAEFIRLPDAIEYCKKG